MDLGQAAQPAGNLYERLSYRCGYVFKLRRYALDLEGSEQPFPIVTVRLPWLGAFAHKSEHPQDKLPQMRRVGGLLSTRIAA